MASLSVQRLFVRLLFLLLHANSLMTFSLKGCIITSSENPLAEVSVDCSGHNLVTVPDHIPTHVRSLNLCFNNLEKLNREAFGKLSKLQMLNLHGNEISHADDGSFLHLGELTTLDMSANNMVNLTANLFQGLSKLIRLDLSDNNIRFIHPTDFKFLSSLQTLVLKGNTFNHITDFQPVLQLPRIQMLSISFAICSSFDTKDLTVNVSSGLKILNVTYNELPILNITPRVFPQLETLKLCGSNRVNKVKWEIPTNITELIISDTKICFEDASKVLQSLKSLTLLRLNYMDDLINDTLLETVCRIQTLRKLDLSYNGVVNFGKNLVTCSQLSDLDLSFSHRTELPKDSIQSMQRLRSLNLKSISLSKVPDDIRSLSTLEILNLSNNLISDLGCEDFINTTSLRELYLNTNRIVKLNSCVFQYFTHLIVLDLSNNLLETIGDTFKLGPKRLMFLNLSSNFILAFDRGGFQGLRSLKYLDVSNNIVKLENNAFDGLINLESLSISVISLLYFRIKQLQQLKNLNFYFSIDINLRLLNPYLYEVLYSLRSMKVFTVTCNTNPSDLYVPILIQTLQSMKQLEEFTAENVYSSAPDSVTFCFNNELKNLTIRKTDLSHLDSRLFEKIPNLQVLEFSNCKLKSLDFLALANLSALRYLKLTYNEISVINETVFQSLPALTYLDLDNNPFTCDCTNAGFIQWVKNNKQTQVVNAYQYACFFPVAAQGSKLMDFDVQPCWTDLGFICFISSTCLVLLTLLLSFIYHFLRWQLAYGFYLFLAFVYDSRKKKKGAPHQYDAFVSYNVLDEDWVYREMLPVLEGEQGWRLCLHHRDFQPGKPIMDNITDAIYGSRKTICVITRRYLQSEWCSAEIQMASFRLFDEQKDVLILLFLEDIPARQLSPYYRMRQLVKKRTYLSWPQAGQHKGLFWQNVRRALETGHAPTDTNLLIGPEGC